MNKYAYIMRETRVSKCYTLLQIAEIALYGRLLEKKDNDQIAKIKEYNHKLEQFETGLASPSESDLKLISKALSIRIELLTPFDIEDTQACDEYKEYLQGWVINICRTKNNMAPSLLAELMLFDESKSKRSITEKAKIKKLSTRIQEAEKCKLKSKDNFNSNELEKISAILNININKYIQQIIWEDEDIICLPKLKKTHVINFYSQKGGVGKTTIIRELSYILSEIHRYKILILDCDTQRNSTLTITGQQDFKKNFYTLFYNHSPLYTGEKVNLVDDLKETILPYKNSILGATNEYFDNIKFIPSSDKLGKGEQVMIGWGYAQIFFNQIFEEIRNLNEFDFVFIDNCNAINLVTEYILDACDHTLMICRPDRDSLQGCTNTLAQIAEQHKNVEYGISASKKKTDIIGVLINQLVTTTEGVRMFAEECKRIYGDHMFKTEIHMDAGIGNAMSGGIPLAYAYSNSRGAKELVALAEELLQRCKEREEE